MELRKTLEGEFAAMASGRTALELSVVALTLPLSFPETESIPVHAFSFMARLRISMSFLIRKHCGTICLCNAGESVVEGFF